MSDLPHFFFHVFILKGAYKKGDIMSFSQPMKKYQEYTKRRFLGTGFFWKMVNYVLGKK